MSTKPTQPRTPEREDWKYSDNELEDVFLTNSLENYRFFKKQADRLRTAGQDPAMCEQYAEAHRLLLNRFTFIPEPNEQEEDI